MASDTRRIEAARRRLAELHRHLAIADDEAEEVEIMDEANAVITALHTAGDIDQAERRRMAREWLAPIARDEVAAALAARDLPQARAWSLFVGRYA